LYRGEFTAKIPGEYRYSNLNDPTAVLKFDVIEPKLEQSQSAMNEPLLKAMAETSKGHFLREEDLYKLPDLISEKSATTAIFKKVDLYYSPWWAVALLFFAFAEWALRRLSQLK
jgi:hypothetical protein